MTTNNAEQVIERRIKELKKEMRRARKGTCMGDVLLAMIIEGTLSELKQLLETIKQTS